MKSFGILNLTPDSFSDGSAANLIVEQSLARAKQLQARAIDYIDIGAESTRPGANPVSVQEELNRLLPFLDLYDLVLPLSLDSYKPEVIAYVLKNYSQVRVINDVSGLQNPALLKALLDSDREDITFVAMHSKGGIPAIKEVPENFYHEDGGLQEHMLRFFDKTLTMVEEYGLNTERVILDLGFGFGKNFQQSFELLEILPKLKSEFALPILVAASRKRFLHQWQDKIQELRIQDFSNASLDLLSTEFHKLCIDADFIRIH